MLAVASVAAMPEIARADVKQECSAAYDRAQSERAAGRLVSAHREAVLCARDGCADFIKADCGTWLTEIDASTPTVVFEVLDREGKETGAVRVELDGKPWLDALDGKSKPIDPGPHTIRYVLGDGASIDDKVQIREGEKNRKLTAAFPRVAPVPLGETPKPAPALLLGPKPPPPAEPPAEPPPRSAGPWIVGGIGVAGLAVGAILGGVVLHDQSVTSADGCNAATHSCRSSAGLSAASQGRALGPATTVALVAGGIGVAAGVVWLTARSPAKASGAPSALAMGPVVATNGAAWRLQGIW